MSSPSLIPLSLEFHGADACDVALLTTFRATFLVVVAGSTPSDGTDMGLRVACSYARERGAAMKVQLQVEFDAEYVLMVGILTRDRALRDLAAYGSAALSLNDTS